MHTEKYYKLAKTKEHNPLVPMILEASILEKKKEKFVLKTIKKGQVNKSATIIVFKFLYYFLS